MAVYFEGKEVFLQYYNVQGPTFKTCKFGIVLLNEDQTVAETFVFQRPWTDFDSVTDEDLQERILELGAEYITESRASQLKYIQVRNRFNSIFG